MLLKGIVEATTVQTPTTFVLREEMLPDPPAHSSTDSSGLTGITETAFERGLAWLQGMARFREGVEQNDPKAVFDEVQDAVDKLPTAETMYFYLVDELTGEPVRGEGYPIEISSKSDLVPKLLPVMQVGVRAMSIYNGVAGVARMFCWPLPSVPEEWCDGAQASVEILKQASLAALS